MRAPALLLPALLPLCLALACAKNTGSSAGGSLANDIELTGVDALDQVFVEARDLDELLDNARVQLNSGRSNLNSALSLPQGTPFADALSELSGRAQGKLQVVMDGQTPAIRTTDAVPSNVQAAVDSANGALASYQAALADVTRVGQESAEVARAVGSLSETITTDAGSLGLKLSEIPSVARTAQHNLGLVQNFPNRVDKLTGELVANLDAVRGGLGGAAPASTQASPTQSTATETEEPKKPVALPR